ncbi:MAG TPA: hypothetical protein VJ011_04560 [Steroidobacteraceae bacterium]|nr:hypothetical protein [Steroidobacteraceae bacterium]
MSTHDDEAVRRKRAVRAAILLGLVALAFYAGFILLSVMRSSP